MSHGKQVRYSEDLKTAGAREEGNGVENGLVFHSFTSQWLGVSLFYLTELCATEGLVLHSVLFLHKAVHWDA